MPKRVRLSDIVDALELQGDEVRGFVNRETGEVVTVSLALLGEAEEFDESDPPEILSWQEREWDMAKQIVSSDDFLRLPTKFDVHEWQIMRDFAAAVTPGLLSDELLDAIHGAGAFRMFKATVRRRGLDKAWYAFRDDALLAIARQWRHEKGIEYD